MASKQKVTPEQEIEEFQIGPELFVRMVDVSALKEQDINAQVMEERHFDRLTENIKIRGALESLPYCHQPSGEGPVSIISGHHRSRAARTAGLGKIPVIVDTRDMDRSQVTAKQIAHNELHGQTDATVLQQLLLMIDSADDLLMTGLDEATLPTIEPDDTSLLVPSADFDFRMMTLMFLPSHLPSIMEAVKMIDTKTEVLGVANRDQFAEFSKAVIDYGKVRNVKNLATTVGVLIDLAERELADVDGEHTVPAISLGLGHLTEKQAAALRRAMDAEPDADLGDLIEQWAEEHVNRHGGQ